MSDESPEVDNARREVTFALVRLERFFAPDSRLTFVMRHPSSDDAYMIITADDLEAVIATIRRDLETRPAR